MSGRGLGLGFGCTFPRLRSIRLSWHTIQNNPFDVRAYFKFWIDFLQLRHSKHFAQKAASPVNIARSSIFSPHVEQSYVHLSQIKDPSPRSKRLESGSIIASQVVQRKQSVCQRLPAIDSQLLTGNSTRWDSIYQVQRRALLLKSRHKPYRGTHDHLRTSVSGCCSSHPGTK